MDKDFYSIKEFAAKLNVSSHTIRRAIKKARINAFRVGASEKSTYRIPHSELTRLGVVNLQAIIKQMIQEGKQQSL